MGRAVRPDVTTIQMRIASLVGGPWWRAWLVAYAAILRGLSELVAGEVHGVGWGFHCLIISLMPPSDDSENPRNSMVTLEAEALERLAVRLVERKAEAALGVKLLAPMLTTEDGDAPPWSPVAAC